MLGVCSHPSARLKFRVELHCADKDKEKIENGQMIEKGEGNQMERHGSRGILLVKLNFSKLSELDKNISVIFTVPKTNGQFASNNSGVVNVL